MARTVCVMLWERVGRASDLAAYEDTVLALVAEHGGAVLSRVRSNGESGVPREVQVIRFPNAAAFDGYLNDGRRLALAAQRDAAIERTDVFDVEQIV